MPYLTNDDQSRVQVEVSIVIRFQSIIGIIHVRAASTPTVHKMMNFKYTGLELSSACILFHDVATIFFTMIYYQFRLKFRINMTKKSNQKYCRQFHIRFSDIIFMYFDNFFLVQRARNIYVNDNHYATVDVEDAVEIFWWWIFKTRKSQSFRKK